MTSPETIAVQSEATEWRRFHDDNIALGLFLQDPNTLPTINQPVLSATPPDPLVLFEGHKSLRILPFGGNAENRPFDLSLVLVDRVGLPDYATVLYLRRTMFTVTCTCGNVTGDVGGLVPDIDFFANDLTALTQAIWATDMQTAFAAPAFQQHDPADAAGGVAEIFIPDAGNTWAFYIRISIGGISREGNALYRLESRRG
jgi:hypothetical protein